MISASVSVVLPAKNEEASIGSLVKELLTFDFVTQVLVVDDGSSDGTGAIAAAAGAEIVRHAYSKGNGAAIKSGARAATGEVIVFMDGDGQHSPADIPALLDKINEGFDLVVGARSKGGQASLGRSFANNLYNKLASFIVGQRVEDLTSGFRAVVASKFREFLYLLPNGFSYPTTSTMAFFRAGYSVAFIPISVSKRVGSSHIKPIQDGIRFLLIIFKVGTLYSPLKIFFPMSFFIFLIGISYYGFTYYTQGRFTNMSALMFTTSLIVFMVGLVSEQITALMYKDSKIEK
ncbi:MAG: glycosyltransferase family 2 protein [Marinobacter sp.]|nr:glycosyltransferase family 2 protein [Marinobacter sp.]